MKTRLLLLLLLASFVSLPALRAEDPTAKPSAEETELELTMEKMNSAYRKIRRQLADASKNADTLAQVAVMREMTEASLKLEPAMKADKPAEEQAKFVAAYQAKMKETSAELGKLEAALKAGNNEEAAKIFAGLGDLQKQAHKEFRRPVAKKS